MYVSTDFQPLTNPPESPGTALRGETSAQGPAHAPFRWVGSPQVRRQSRLGEAPTTHLVYEQLLDALVDRQAVDALTREIVPALLPATKARMIREGFSPLDICQSEAELIAMADSHPKWEVWQSAPKSLYVEMKSENRVNTLIDHRIVAIPGRFLNAIVCSHLRTLFSEAEILSTPGFVMKRYAPTQDGEEPIYSLRIDLEDWYARQGFLVPVMRGRFIQALRVFRYPRDERPFILKSRGEVPLNA